MTKTSLVAPVLLAATVFASMHSCKKKSDTTPATRITSFTDSIVQTYTGSSVTITEVGSFTLSYSDDKLSSVKGIIKEYTSSGVSVDSFTKTYSYVDGKCIIATTGTPTVDTVYLDGDGRITKVNSEAVTYHDGTKKIKSYYGRQYTWNGDNLATVIGGDTATYTYLTGKDASMADPSALSNYLQYGRAMWTNKNLISAFSTHSSGMGYNLTVDYTFEGSGRVSSAVTTLISFGSATTATVKSYYTYNY
jgi:hypothetical protein